MSVIFSVSPRQIIDRQLMLLTTIQTSQGRPEFLSCQDFLSSPSNRSVKFHSEFAPLSFCGSKLSFQQRENTG
jgi:hypothetical protein